MGRCGNRPYQVSARLTVRRGTLILFAVAGGVLVSTMKMRQRRHAEDGSWASLIIEPKITANQELALAA